MFAATLALLHVVSMACPPSVCEASEESVLVLRSGTGVSWRAGPSMNHVHSTRNLLESRNTMCSHFVHHRLMSHGGSVGPNAAHGCVVDYYGLPKHAFYTVRQSMQVATRDHLPYSCDCIDAPCCCSQPPAADARCDTSVLEHPRRAGRAAAGHGLGGLGAGHRAAMRSGE